MRYAAVGRDFARMAAMDVEELLWEALEELTNLMERYRDYLPDDFLAAGNGPRDYPKLLNKPAECARFYECASQVEFGS